MMKYFYKSFLIALISGSMTTMNMTAYAETAIAQMSTAPSSNLTRDANGVVKNTESHSFSGTKDDGPLHVITMIAVGIIGTKLLMYKKWTTDMTIVAAASAAYIAAEIVNIMNLKSQMKDMTIEVTKSADGKVDQAQIETLEKLKESYMKVRKSANTKMMLQKAAGTAFLVGAGVAAYQRYSEDGKFASCEAGIAAGLEQLTAGEVTATAAYETAVKAYQTALSTPGYGTAAAAALAKTVATTQAAKLEYASCIEQVNLVQTAVTKYKAACDAEVAKSPSMFSFSVTRPAWTAAETTIKTPCAGTTGAPAIKTATVTPSCSTYLTEAEFNKAFGSPPAATGGSHTRPNGIEKMLFFKESAKLISMETQVEAPAGFRKYLQNGLDLIFPKAQAGMMASLGLVGAAATTLVLTKYKLTQTIDTWMFTPGARIIAWGIMSGAAFLGASATKKEIDEIDGHISDIDKILKDMNTLKNGIKSNNMTEQQIRLAAFQATQNQDIPLNVNPNEKTDCLTSSGSSKCQTLADTLRGMPDFANLPDSFKSIASQSAQLGDGVSGNSISGGTMSLAQMLANKQGAIAKLNNSIKSKINSNLAKSGKAPIDFDKQEKDLWNKLKGQTDKSLKSRGSSGGAFLASTGISSIPTSVLASSSPAASMKKTAALSSVGAMPSGAKDKNKEFDLDFKEAAVADGAGFGSGAGTKDDKFDIGSNDINTNSGESIFQVISNRYIKSGYPKLLDEIPVKN